MSSPPAMSLNTYPSLEHKAVQLRKGVTQTAPTTDITLSSYVPSRVPICSG